ELSQEVNFEMAETLVRLHRLSEASGYFKTADEKFDEVLDNLPAEFRQSYGSRRRTGATGARSPKPLKDSKRLTTVTIRESSALAGIKGAASAEESLRMVNDLMVALGTGGSLKEFLGKMLDDFLAILKADAAYLLLVQGDNLTVEISRALGGNAAGDAEEVICLNLIEKVLESRNPLFLADIADDPVVASV